MYRLVDYITQKPVSTDNLVFTGLEGPWEVKVDLDRVKSLVNHDYFRASPPLASKYLPFLPIQKYGNFISLKEGNTPLIQSRVLGEKIGADLYFKMESKGPTGSFKDRGSAVELTVAKEKGAKAIVVASTGNMAASCACYAAAAQIPCFVFVPEGVPSSKLAQVISYGGRIVQIKGNYNDAARMAREAADKLGFYLAGDYAFRVEGAKTAAFEVIDQLYYQVPDYVVVPMGCGTNIAGYAKGFEEYHRLGFIDRVPALIGVQAEGASTIVASFNRGEKEVTPLSSVSTLASAIAIADPLDGKKALDALYNTGGAGIALTDREMLESQYMMSREEGIFTELSGGATYAALRKLSETTDLKGKRIVCVMCGDGLKDPTTVLKISVKPPSIQPTVDDFISLYDRGFFEGKTVSFVDRTETLFTDTPSPKDLKLAVKNLLEIELAPELIGRVHELVDKFLKKGKSISYADFQDIVQDATEVTAVDQKRFFHVKDFDVKTGKDRQPKASVVIEVDKEEHQGKGTGVGPVDALIAALRNACGEKLRFELTSYDVNIRSQGADAVVYVELKLRQNGVVTVGAGVSPDIIQASIEAFEEAYNAFPK